MENVQLTVADMVSLKNILEAACQRGAFKATEMSAVGQLYDKLDAFVEAATSQLQQSPDATADSDPAAGVV